MDIWIELMEACVGAAGLLTITLLLVYFAIERNLPENLVATPVDDDEIPMPLYDAMGDLEDLHYERVGPALVLGLMPRPTVVAYYDPASGSYGNVFHVPSKPPKNGYDFVTLLAHGGTLTTGMDLGGGALALAPGCFMQIFPRAAPHELWIRHREAVDFLHDQGVQTVQADPDRYEEDLREALRRQRRTFLQARIANTLRTLYRSAFRTTPYQGPLQRQHDARNEIDALAYGPLEHQAH